MAKLSFMYIKTMLIVNKINNGTNADFFDATAEWLDLQKSNGYARLTRAQQLFLRYKFICAANAYIDLHFSNLHKKMTHFTR